MNPRIAQLQAKVVVGMKSQMQHQQYQNIVALWKQFMPQQVKINNRTCQEFIALQNFSDFGNPVDNFEIWACVEVTDSSNLPEGMQSFQIPEGDYAIFPHKGMNAGATYQKIMTEWLPKSGYKIADRPHFQVMGEKYKNGSPDSEEDFYVPVEKL
jgi:AraC family transcriptional regulator